MVSANLCLQMQLYVWDESKYLPLLVRNKAAEVLFGNIKAERVYLCYRGQSHDWNPNPKDVQGSDSSHADKNLKWKENHRCDKMMNFYSIWFIFLKLLLQQGKNSPLKFEVTINASLDRENGRFEMVSMSMPCFRAK